MNIYKDERIQRMVDDLCRLREYVIFPDEHAGNNVVGYGIDRVNFGSFPGCQPDAGLGVWFYDEGNVQLVVSLNGECCEADILYDMRSNEWGRSHWGRWNCEVFKEYVLDNWIDIADMLQDDMLEFALAERSRVSEERVKMSASLDRLSAYEAKISSVENLIRAAGKKCENWSKDARNDCEKVMD